MLRGQASRELDLDADYKVTALVRLLALGHAQLRVSFCPCGTRGTAAAHTELLAVDGLYGASPAGQGFFEVEFDGALDVVAVASKEGVGFLGSELAG